MQTHFALLPVQIELVLTDGHHPDGFNQRMAGIPCVNDKTCLSKGSLGHCSSVEDNKTNTCYYKSDTLDGKQGFNKGLEKKSLSN